MNTQQAKLIPIPDYLEHLGYTPTRAARNGAWYHSMLATSGDGTPSFQVSADGRAFHDWSTGACGSIVDLAMCIVGRHDVSAALAHIEATVGCPAPVASKDSFSFYQQKKSLTILSVGEVITPALLAYARNRGIPADITCAYCSEVKYRMTSSGKVYFSLGWPNDAGGWELRNRYSKLAAAPKDISIVNDLIGCTMLVFEGFFDFLSAAALCWFRPLEMNALVLNSTALLDRAIPLLQQASRVICLLDNDDSGRNATKRILKSCPQSEDHSYLYARCKDVSDYLMNDSTINKVAHEWY